MKETIQEILKNHSYEQSYNERVARYKNLSCFVPDKYIDIANRNGPWFVHSLAFRMATYSLESEKIFLRLNDLIETAKHLYNWKNELNNSGLSWSYNYDEFFHFLWMLQCMEHFVDGGFDVQFSNITKKQPDLTIKSIDNNQFFAECYVYSKWWFKEAFLEDIIRLIHPCLRIERIYNQKSTNTGNTIDDLLNGIGNITAQSKLAIAEKEASVQSHYILNESGGIRLVFEGDGEYQASSINAHGDPAASANVYLHEIVKHKENQNDLKSHRPNVLFINGLGIDFQNIFFSESSENLFLESTVIDKVELFACGIDEKLRECNRRLTIVH